MSDNDQIIQEILKLNNQFVEEIISLKRKNTELEERVNYLTQHIGDLFEMQKSLVETINNNQNEMKILSEAMVRSVDNVTYEITEKRHPIPNIAGIDETLDKIINEKCSICRYGDGEFSIMMGKARQRFQKQDERLAQKLTEVLRNKDAKVLVAIADNYGPLDKYSSLFKNEIRYYMTDEVRAGHQKLLEEGRTYYNAYITTPYLLFNDWDTDGPGKRFDKLKRIWENRNVILIEGQLSRLGAGNDLFDNAASLVRILCPPENAFSKYDTILMRALETGKAKEGEEPIFLISLGPTATVLAYDIHKAGFQAVDIGHVDNDYEHFLRKLTDRKAIPGKYASNITRVEDVENMIDERYLKQIICTID